MGAPVGEEAGSVIAVTTPTAAVISGAAFAVIRADRRLTLPTVPIETFRNRLFGEIAMSRRIAKADKDFLNFADRSALDDRGHVAVIFHNALRTARADAVVFARGLNDDSRFLRGKGQRFFAIDVFTGLARLDGDFRVPVVGARADNRVDVVANENVFIMRVLRSRVVLIVVVDAVGGSVEMVLIAVANAQNVVVRIAEEPAQQFVAAIAKPDVEQIDLIARRHAAVESEDTARHEERRGNCACGRR